MTTPWILEAVQQEMARVVAEEEKHPCNCGHIGMQHFGPEFQAEDLLKGIIPGGPFACIACLCENYTGGTTT